MRYHDSQVLYENITEVLSDYKKDGIVYIRNLINNAMINELFLELHRAEMKSVEDIRQRWNNKKTYFYSKNAAKSNETSYDYATQDYFLQSHDKAHIFYEMLHDVCAINRIGHGMHLLKEFKTIQNIVYSNSIVQTLLTMTGFVKPICQLSVYIPKHANDIGSDVRPHQESTFVYTEPQTVVVLWIALEDADIENACMWGILGSQKWPLQYMSKVDLVAKNREFVRINNEVLIPDFEKQKECFVPLEVKAGDALYFHGNFVHCSPVNKSLRSRKSLSLQFIETHNTYYSSSNWLQPRNNKFIYTLKD